MLFPRVLFFFYVWVVCCDFAVWVLPLLARDGCLGSPLPYVAVLSTVSKTTRGTVNRMLSFLCFRRAFYLFECICSICPPFSPLLTANSHTAIADNPRIKHTRSTRGSPCLTYAPTNRSPPTARWRSRSRSRSRSRQPQTPRCHQRARQKIPSLASPQARPEAPALMAAALTAPSAPGLRCHQHPHQQAAGKWGSLTLLWATAWVLLGRGVCLRRPC